MRTEADLIEDVPRRVDTLYTFIYPVIYLCI